MSNRIDITAGIPFDPGVFEVVSMGTRPGGDHLCGDACFNMNDRFVLDCIMHLHRMVEVLLDLGIRCWAGYDGQGAHLVVPLQGDMCIHVTDVECDLCLWVDAGYNPVFGFPFGLHGTAEKPVNFTTLLAGILEALRHRELVVSVVNHMINTDTINMLEAEDLACELYCSRLGEVEFEDDLQNRTDPEFVAIPVVEYPAVLEMADPVRFDTASPRINSMLTSPTALHWSERLARDCEGDLQRWGDESPSCLGEEI